jgi:predicted transcriptional regulator
LAKLQRVPAHEHRALLRFLESRDLIKPAGPAVLSRRFGRLFGVAWHARESLQRPF